MKTSLYRARAEANDQLFQMRDDGLNQDGSNKGGGKGVDSGCILHAECTELAGELDTWQESVRRGKGGKRCFLGFQPKRVVVMSRDGTQGEKWIGQGRIQAIYFSHISFTWPLDIQVEMSSRLLDK